MNALETKIANAHHEFIKTHMTLPSYAVCEIRWCDSKEYEAVVIAMFDHCDDFPKEADDQIFFYCDGLSELMSLAANIDFTKDDDMFIPSKGFYAEVEKYDTDDPESEDWTYLHRGEDFAIVDILSFT